MDENNPINYPLASNPPNEILGNEVVQFNHNNTALFDDLDLDEIASGETRGIDQIWNLCSNWRFI